MFRVDHVFGCKESGGGGGSSSGGGEGRRVKSLRDGSGRRRRLIYIRAFPLFRPRYFLGLLCAVTMVLVIELKIVRTIYENLDR